MTNEERIDELAEIILDDDNAISDFKDDCRVKDIIDRLNLLDWFLENIYIASGMMEMKKCPPDNTPFRGDYCNGIQIVDKDFDKWCTLARRFLNQLREDKKKRHEYLSGKAEDLSSRTGLHLLDFYNDIEKNETKDFDKESALRDFQKLLDYIERKVKEEIVF